MEVRPIDEEAEKYAVCQALRKKGKGSIERFKDGTWLYKTVGFSWPNYKKVPWHTFGLKVKSERAYWRAKEAECATQ